MEAFEGAVSMGYRHVETDLRMTSDGALVCLHDRTVDRTTGGSGRIADLPYEEAAKLDAGYRHAAGHGFPFRGLGVGIPRLEELVTSFPDVGIVVDLKADGMARAIARLIERHRLHDRVVIGSFSDRRLREVREATGGRVATSTGSAESRRWLAASRLGRPVPGFADALQVPRSLRGVRIVDARLVHTAHAAGLAVHVWTVNERAEMERLLDLGVDGIVTDRVDLLREVLESRGEWAS
jgi:glycerophosphoryl diester phosphodiesterase